MEARKEYKINTVQTNKTGLKYTIPTTVVNYKPSDYRDLLFDELLYASQGSPYRIAFDAHPVSNVLKKYQSKKALISWTNFPYV
jgi:hypothetical protein